MTKFSLHLGGGGLARDFVGPEGDPRLVACTMLGMGVASFNTACLIVGAPVILRDLHVGVGGDWNLVLLVLLLSGFTAGVAAFSPIAGTLSVAVGEKRALGCGFGVFAIGAIGSAMVPSDGARGLTLLVVFRLVQAVGGALLMTLATAIASSAFSEATRGRAIALNQVAWTSGLAAGLLAGGPLVVLNWRLMLLACGLIAAIGMVWTYWVLAPWETTNTSTQLDWLGTGSYAVAIACVTAGLLLVLHTGGGALSSGTMSAVVMGTGVVVLALYIIVSLRPTTRSRQAVGIRLFSNRGFLFGNLAGFFASTARSGIPVVVAVWLQAVILPLRGVSIRAEPIVSIEYFAPLGFGTVAATLFAGRFLGASAHPRRPWQSEILRRTRLTRLFTSGAMALAAASLLALPLGGANPSAASLIPTLALFGIATGLFLTPNTTAIMNSVEKESYDIASGTRLAVVYLGVGLSAFVCFAILQSGLHSHLSAGSRSLAGLGASCSAQHLLICSVIDPGSANAALAHRLSGPFRVGLERVCMVSAALCLLAGTIAWRRRPGTAEDVEVEVAILGSDGR